MSNFPEKLRQAMHEKRCKSADVAKGTGISPSVLSRYLSGRNKPSSDNILAISHYLNVSPEWLLSSSDASESTKKTGLSVELIEDKNKIIKLLEKEVDRLGGKTTPDGAIKKLFDLIDQSGSYGVFGLGMGSYDENDENHKWVFSEMERLDVEMKTIRSMFFSEEEIQDSQNANMERVKFRPPKSPKRGRPRKG